MIAITGGSVAMDFYFYVRTHDEFLSALRRHPEFADTDIRFVSLALDGMKQPQQLVALNYFLAGVS
ncbi:MAG: hypothetical protein GY953_55430 [bacterium]|nr:hypothetical protein [bacterium]